MAKLTPELRRLIEQERRRQSKVDEAKDVILGACIVEATAKRMSLYDAARELAEILPQEQRQQWLDTSSAVIDLRLSRAAEEARQRVLYPGGK